MVLAADRVLALSIPVFFVMIALEAIYSARRGLPYMRLNDSLASLGCGITTLVFEMFTKGALFIGFDYMYRHWAPYKFALDDWRAWILFFVVYDFLYYWAHRIDHRNNFFWNVHAPHHQSEEFNLTTALRQGAFQDTLNFPIFLPMALMGCPVELFAIERLINKLYQFWLHTRTIERIPVIEGVLNTPAAHRVHHAINGPYIDKNFGGTLMIWDKLFGSWEDERADEPCAYGITTPYHNWNPIWAQVDWWRRLSRDARATKKWSDKAKIWFMHSGWRPADVAHIEWPHVEVASQKKYDTQATRNQKIAAVVAYVIAAIGLLALFTKHHTLSWQINGAGVVLVLGALWFCARMLTGNPKPKFN